MFTSIIHPLIHYFLLLSLLILIQVIYYLFLSLIYKYLNLDYLAIHFSLKHQYLPNDFKNSYVNFYSYVIMKFQDQEPQNLNFNLSN